MPGNIIIVMLILLPNDGTVRFCLANCRTRARMNEAPTTASRQRFGASERARLESNALNEVDVRQSCSQISPCWLQLPLWHRRTADVHRL